MDRPELLEYPPKPVAPPYHNVPLSKVPKDEIDDATRNTKEYLELLEKFKAKRDEITKENRRREAEYEKACWDEIYDENGIDANEREHELVKWVARTAWDKGHSYGMSEVKSYFYDFIEAYEIHRKLLHQSRSELAQAHAKTEKK